MKDPLHEKVTPYEILGVPLFADKKAVEAAFKKGMLSGKNVAELSEARLTLNRPIEKLLIDVFLYDAFFTGQLAPRVWGDSSRLLENRSETVAAWANINKKLFPHYPAIHSLGLVWYWLTIYSEEKQWAQLNGGDIKNDNLAGEYSLLSLWSNVIAHWVFIINSDDFWRVWTKSKEQTGVVINAGDIELLCQRLESHFINLFHSYSEKYRNSGQPEKVKHYQKYELLFATEMKTAKQLLKVGTRYSMNNGKFSVCCGRLMLEQVGILGEVQSMLADPTILSEHKEIAVLIENRKYDEAIQAIKSLPSEEKGSKEILRLSAKAHLEKGKQVFSTGQYTEAFHFWREGLATEELQKELTEVVVNHSHSKAKALEGNDPQAAIDLLEMALRFVDDESLKALLALIYFQMGIKLINNAQEEHMGTPTKLRQKIEEGIRLIKKAIALDPSKAHFKEQLRIIEQMLASLYNAEGVELANKAGELIKNGDVRFAKTKLQEAKALVQKAVEIDNTNSTYKENLRQVGQTLEMINKSDGKLQVGGVQNSIAAKLNAEGVELANEAGHLLEKGNIDSAFVKLLEASAKLSEAVNIDKSNRTYKENLDQINKLLAMVGNAQQNSNQRYLDVSKNSRKVLFTDTLRKWLEGIEKISEILICFSLLSFPAVLSGVLNNYFNLKSYFLSLFGGIVCVICIVVSYRIIKKKLKPWIIQSFYLLVWVYLLIVIGARQFYGY